MNLNRCTDGQCEAITTLNAPLMVSAGAGSGKTFTLTQRIVAALLPQEGKGACCSDIDQILAITYTKKAAAELRSRVKAALLKEGLREQALAAENAWISTIHGMASRILRECALELGIDPAFQVVSEQDGVALRRQAFELVLERVRQTQGSESRSIRQLLKENKLWGVNRNDKGVGDKVFALLDRVQGMPGGFDSLVCATPDKRPNELLRELYSLGLDYQAQASTWSKSNATDGKHLAALCDALVQAQEYLNTAPDVSFDHPSFDARAFRKVFFAFPPTSAKYRAKAEDADFFANYRCEYARLANEVDLGCGMRERQAIVDLAQMVDAAYAQLKGPERLDNADLLLMLHAALNSHPEIAAAYRERFVLIMVDEFQDTDELQVSLIRALSRDGGNIATVGDAQQSIYRFRGADVNVFLSYKEGLEAAHPDARFICLPDNFRSHGDVLSLVDRVFSQREVFGKDFLHLEPRGDVNVEPDDVFDGTGIARIALDVVHYHRPASAAQARESSARRIAQRFAELRDAGADPGDMVVLLGGMTKAQVYVDALRQAGFECVVTGGSVFSESDEALLVDALLKVARNRFDEEPLLVVLSSPLFALSDDVLLACASKRDEAGAVAQRGLAAGFFEGSLAPEGDAGAEACGRPADEHAASGDGGQDAPVDPLCDLGPQSRAALESARALLGAFVRAARRGPVSVALRSLFVDSGLYARLQQGGADGLAKAGNLVKAIGLVAEFEAEGIGVAGLSERYSAHLSFSKEAPGTLSLSTSSFVRIMTVHASKGLEFGHVAVAELGTGKVSAERMMVENLHGKTYLSVRPSYGNAAEKTCSKLAGFLDGEEAQVPALREGLALGQMHESLAAHRATQELAEARRLLYVALTRAAKSLILCIASSSKEDAEYAGQGIHADLHAALRWDTSSDASVQQVDFGGSASARLRFTVLREAGEDPDAALAAPNEGVVGESLLNEGNRPGAFVLPAQHTAPSCYGRTWQGIREDVRSYSSLAKDTAPEQRVEFSLSEGVASDEGVEWAAGELEPLALGSSATALGTAFHRLCQRAILSCASDEAKYRVLALPDEAAVAAQAKRNQLAYEQQARLQAALRRWFESDEAASFASHGVIQAEVPFVLCLAGGESGRDGDCSPAAAASENDGRLYLEGEIDGLAFDALDGEAYLIDYKTGGNAAETDEHLHEKHLLQAQCYATALLRSGFSGVDARFVRVEQEDADNPGQPQVVRYRFDRHDLPRLQDVVLSAYRDSLVDGPSAANKRSSCVVE